MICILFLAGFFSLAKAQVSINKTNTPPHPSAMLDMSLSGNSGLGVLIPRITIGHATDNSRITNPADYLLVFSPSSGTTDFTGLNCWHQNHWKPYLSSGAAFDMLTSFHIAQTVLFVEQFEPEKIPHTSGSSGYTLHLDIIKFDSQRTYNPATYQYVIPEAGVYEITCGASIESSVAGTVSSELHIRKNNLVSLNHNFVSRTNSSYNPMVNTVTCIEELAKKDTIHCTLNFGNWGTENFTVKSAYMMITRY
ncbi:MAG: hypothetical protein LBQ78_06985 [Tannerellaceae bacterium]|nr:hypothetical protein [Tannerellaceae bacterium]